MNLSDRLSLIESVNTETFISRLWNWSWIFMTADWEAEGEAVYDKYEQFARDVEKLCESSSIVVSTQLLRVLLKRLKESE
jgi:hypothetical protein